MNDVRILSIWHAIREVHSGSTNSGAIRRSVGGPFSETTFLFFCMRVRRNSSRVEAFWIELRSSKYGKTSDEHHC